MLVGHDALQKEFIGLAKRGALAHGYIFLGPQGVGKFSFAYSLANFLENGGRAGGAASGAAGAKAFEPTSVRPLSDTMVIRLGEEERSLGVDAVRGVKAFLQQKPFASKYRTVIIDQAEALTAEAENALLKVTEEPTPYALIILVVTDPEELLPTLQSRMHTVFFAPLYQSIVVEWLVNGGTGKEMEKEEAAEFAIRSFGRPGLAYKMKNDAKFQGLLEAAEDFLRGTPASRKSVIKSLTDEETFSLDAFLETLMIAAFPKLKTHAPFWHSIFSLRESARRFGLNAKLQLTALQKVLESR